MASIRLVLDFEFFVIKGDNWIETDFHLKTTDKLLDCHRDLHSAGTQDSHKNR